MNAAARRALSLAAVALLLVWVALSLTAGGARLGAARHLVPVPRVQHDAWPLWAHGSVAAHPVASPAERPVAAMAAPTEALRSSDAPIAAPGGLVTPAPVRRRAVSPPSVIKALTGIGLPVATPPPRAA